MADDDLGAWAPMSPGDVARLFEGSPSPWWVAGGYAIDAFVGRGDRRAHDDIDAGILARDQLAIRAATLAEWDLHCVDPPGRLRPWRAGEVLEEPIHDVWARERADRLWRLQLLLNPTAGDDWVFRRDPRIRRPVAELAWRRAGIPYLVPEVQLLFKAKDVREKDEQDFADAGPLLSPDQRHWLRDALRSCAPGHHWIERL